MGDVLEAREMDLGLCGIAGALQSAGETELGRGMHGIDAYASRYSSAALAKS